MVAVSGPKSTPILNLKHTRPENLEVPALETIRVHGVIGASARALEKLQAPIQPVRGFDHVLLEVFEAEQAGARARHENPTGFHEPDRELIEVFVFLPAFPVAVLRSE